MLPTIIPASRTLLRPFTAGATIACAAALIVALSVGSASAQDVYPVGFTWHRATDWTPRPPADNFTTNGNPDDDQTGRAVWMYENNTPPGNFGSIGSAFPWYIAHPAQNYVRCAWDPSWFGTALSGWALGNDGVPITYRDGLFAYQGFYYSQTAWQCWVNAGSCRTTVRVTGNPRLIWGGNSNTAAADVVILVRRATGAHEILLATSFPHPSPGNELTFGVDLPGIVVGPGDSLVRTVRFHEQGTDISNYVIFVDDLTYTLDANATTISTQPAPLRMCPGGPAVFSVATAVPGTHTYQWRRAGVVLANGPTGTGSTIAGADGPTLTISGVGVADAGSHDCLVTDACGSVASNPATLTVCVADFSCDGFVNSQDFFDFLAAFFVLQPAADFNHDTFINSQDFFDFLAAFFSGC